MAVLRPLFGQALPLTLAEQAAAQRIEDDNLIIRQETRALPA